MYWNNAVLNEAPEGKRDNINVLAWIFNLINQYELGNYGLLPFLLKSTYNFLKKQKRLYEVEKVIIEFLKDKLLKASS